MSSICIPLGVGSRWNNTELRYCLRSVEKHLTGYGDVFIVGEKPEWLRNVIHIQCSDLGDKTYDKERNIFFKILAACNEQQLSEDFLFMNDDHFLLKEYEAGSFPYYYDSMLADKMTVTDYKHTILNTIGLYKEFRPKYYDIHCPILYNRRRFVNAFNWSAIDWAVQFGYCIKTVYCCNSPIGSPIECADLKIDSAYPAAKINELINGRPWFSIGDKAFDGDIRLVLEELYPKKSKYES